jgi:hypothetical protein
MGFCANIPEISLNATGVIEAVEEGEGEAIRGLAGTVVSAVGEIDRSWVGSFDGEEAQLTIPINKQLAHRGKLKRDLREFEIIRVAGE